MSPGCHRAVLSSVICGVLEIFRGSYEMCGERVLQSFVVRLWLERAQNGKPLWRGRIRHVQGTREVPFQDLEKMCEFLQRVTGVPGPSLTGSRSPGATVRESSAVTDGKQKT